MAANYICMKNKSKVFGQEVRKVDETWHMGSTS